MKEEQLTLLNKLISGNEINKHLRNRKLEIYKESFENNSTALNEKIAEGWNIDIELRTKTKIFKKKPNDIAFEDKVWTLFALLGFKIMNKDRSFHVPYDKNNEKLTHQIDVFARDDETVLIIECRSSKNNKIGDFKESLEAFKSKKGGVINTLNKLFPNSKPKYKFILATQNLAISDNDDQRLMDIDGIHFDDDVIDYYYELYKQLGHAARYQLLGALFEGQEIPDLDNKIPAIQGKMGGHTYYSFSIEPEKLLKIGYVLHRNKANENLMPTYQRLIKKTRLKQIQNFVDEQKGYFPNSIIINLVTDKNKKLNFDISNKQVENSISRIGILHLPKKYRSAYIIDGQHRLYGYADSMYKNINTIPVVALVSLDRSEQVKLFMQINENQKAVSKDLRNTLDSDLLWDSDNYLEQMKALKSRIAINLGEERKSPFYGRITIGEDKRDISTQQIIITLSKTDFLGKVKAKEIEKLGTFYNGNLENSNKNLSDFLIKSFTYIKNSLEDVWELEGNIIVINKGFYGITLVLNDLVNHCIEKNLIEDPASSNSVFEAIKGFLDTIIHFYKEISDEKTNELRKAYGTPGDAKYWRELQLVLRKDFPQIYFIGLDEYIKREEKENNEEAFKLIREIEGTHLKEFIKNKLHDEFGNSWFKKGTPDKIYTDAVTLAATKNKSIENEEDETSPWDQLNLINYRDIVLISWQKVFEKDFTRPSETKMPGGKDAKTKWMVELNRIRNESSHTYYVTPEELEYITEICEWLRTREN